MKKMIVLFDLAIRPSMHYFFIWFFSVISISKLCSEENPEFRLMTFNILQGGGNAKNVGFGNELFGGSRIDEITSAIKIARADIGRDTGRLFD
jgi:hypothetical protein